MPRQEEDNTTSLLIVAAAAVCAYFLIKKFAPGTLPANTSPVTSAGNSNMHPITLLNGKYMQRGCDAGGCGYFGASRDNGTRKHEGLDILCTAGGPVYAPFDSTADRLVDPYGDGKYSGLQLSAPDKMIKIMYFQPAGGIVGAQVKAGQLLGYAQNIQIRDPKVQPHLHVEIFRNGLNVDPALELFA